MADGSGEVQRGERTEPAGPPDDGARSGPAVDRCANCAAELVGPYCHACGQSARPSITSVRTLLGEIGAEIADLDSRVLRSAAYLLGKPGYLTREYVAGRRVRYVHPVRLYLVVVAAFFFANAYRPFLTFDPATLTITSRLSGAAAAVSLDPADLPPGTTIDAFAERFQAATTGYLPTLLIGLVLVFALLLLGFYRSQRRHYLEHAIFSLHWTALYLVLMIVERLFHTWRLGPVTLGMMVSVVAFAYLVLALRTAYGLSWPGTVLRAVGLFIGFQAVVVLWMMSAIGLAYAVT